MFLKFPPNCTTAAEKTEYCYRAQELLRLMHNLFGKWYKTGITQAEYNNLPNKIKFIFPFKLQLSDENWRSFKVNTHDIIQKKIIDALLKNRDLLKKSTKWNIEVENI